MTIVRDEITKRYIGIKCDEPHCNTLAPDDTEVLAGGGLNNMGWKCSGGRHWCPVHAATRKPSPCIYCNDDPKIQINCYCRDATGGV